MAASGLHLGNDLPSVLFRHLLEVELLASQDVAGLLVLDFLDDAKHTITDDIENIVFFKPLLGRLRLVHIETARRTRIRLGKRSQRGRGLREAVARAVSASPLVRSGEGRRGEETKVRGRERTNDPNNRTSASRSTKSGHVDRGPSFSSRQARQWIKGQTTKPTLTTKLERCIIGRGDEAKSDHESVAYGLKGHGVRRQC